MPAPAYSVARSPRSSAHRSAIAHSPSPSASTHPTGPAYRPVRTAPARSIARARPRAATRDGRRRMERRDELQHVGAGSRSTPRNRVERCHTLAVGSSTGSGSQRSSSQNGPERLGDRLDDDRVLLAVLRTKPISASAFARSSSGSPGARRRAGERVRTDLAAVPATRGARETRRPSPRRRSAPRTCTRPGRPPGADRRQQPRVQSCVRPRPRSSARARPCAARRRPDLRCTAVRRQRPRSRPQMAPRGAASRRRARGATPPRRTARRCRSRVPAERHGSTQPRRCPAVRRTVAPGDRTAPSSPAAERKRPDGHRRAGADPGSSTASSGARLDVPTRRRRRVVGRRRQRPDPPSRPATPTAAFEAGTLGSPTAASRSNDGPSSERDPPGRLGRPARRGVRHAARPDEQLRQPAGELIGGPRPGTRPAAACAPSRREAGGTPSTAAGRRTRRDRRAARRSSARPG